ncbi:uncharacterized protein FA14DRAFT_185626 [Meira miltonrushii]|uniref:Uncharacterized protein n=1 Tax=Meira miltonrushii TaxID=1280837 RepID=A0A316VAJ9_9BASI|nr:uncharacterized protein FA14DRAFT_185626 [Meira miltonrushii]PWN32545.1 hypothetical protein FA14DRAFT_185626 [Meira miltonrushii]
MLSDKYLIVLLFILLTSDALLVFTVKSTANHEDSTKQDDSHRHLNALTRMRKKARLAKPEEKRQLWDNYKNSQIDVKHKNRRKFVHRMWNYREPIEERVERQVAAGTVMYAKEHEAGRIVGRYMFDQAKKDRGKSQEIQRDMLKLKNDSGPTHNH